MGGAQPRRPVVISQFRYSCSCKWQGNDTDVALYHSTVLDHRVEISHPEIPWRTEYVCGCWYGPEESHCCDAHAKASA